VTISTIQFKKEVKKGRKGGRERGRERTKLLIASLFKITHLFVFPSVIYNVLIPKPQMELSSSMIQML
jgi:hypothetical protein